MPEQAYVYILASGFKRLYIGVTSGLEHRVWQHKNHVHPNAFTARYNIAQLVYYECYESVNRAIARETEMKKWNRIKKIALIVGSNPTWRDLSLDWGQPIEPLSPDFVPKPKSWGDS